MTYCHVCFMYPLNYKYVALSDMFRCSFVYLFINDVNRGVLDLNLYFTQHRKTTARSIITQC